MGFLSPWLLALAAAAAVPLILHLFQRQQGPRVTFPALRYLRRAERENARRLRLRQILLLLMRVAAVLLLALAAARPFSRSGGAGHEPTAVVIVLDNSLSSGVVQDDRLVLDDLKNRALDLLADATPEDRFWLLRAGSPDEPALPGDAAATAARVRETEPTAAAADLTAALEHAATLLRAGAEGRALEVVLLSDLQATSFPATVRGAENVRALVWIPEEITPANAALASVEVGGGLAPVAGEASHVAVTVTGAADSAALRLVVNERVVGAGVAGSGETVLIPLPPSPPGLLTGRVEKDPDALRGDDRRWFAVPVVPPPAVRLGAADEFLDNALAVLADAGRIRRVPASGDVLVAPGGAGLDAGTTGAAIITAPDQALELPALNRRLSAAGIPWRYEAPDGAGEARFAPGSANGVLRTLESVRLHQTYGLRTDGSTTDTVLLRLADGAPWAVRGRTARGLTWVLLASALTPEATTLPASAAMVPLLDRLISEWAAVAAPSFEASPGQEVVLPAAATRVVRPDGVDEDVSGGGAYRLGAVAGLYEVFSSDARIAAFAVNPPAAESVLDRLDARTIADRLPSWSVETADDADEWTRDAYGRRLGREITRPILIALLLLLLAEGVAAVTGGQSASGRSAADQGAAPSRRGLRRAG